MAQPCVVNIPVSGLGLRPLPVVFSKSTVLDLPLVSRLTKDRDLVNDCNDTGLKVYVTGDGSDVYEDSVMKVAKTDDGVFHPTLILVGTRLGIDKITPVYWEALKASLQMPQSMGIAGYAPHIAISHFS
jgi:hypothetical protein